MRRMIRAEFPSHGIQGEEFAAEAGTEFTWVLDPIDGTKSFISGYQLYGAQIALAQGARALMGVIEAPALGERGEGFEGAATLGNGAAVHTSGCATIEQARVYSTTTDAFEGERLRRYDAYSRRALIRRYGGDCYLYGMLAAGPLRPGDRSGDDNGRLAGSGSGGGGRRWQDQRLERPTARCTFR